ncbi:MAG TPA: hypothetical protein VHZ28_00935 [Terracidiphilus sp.]|nr:hypothetical protein [Terracidiphilus sp.]
MTTLRWFSVFCFALALVCRVVGRYVSFDFAVAVAPGVHRTVLPAGSFFFWVFLLLGAVLMTASFRKVESSNP